MKAFPLIVFLALMTGCTSSGGPSELGNNAPTTTAATPPQPPPNTRPTADFGFTPSSPQAGDIVRFTDSSFDNDGSIAMRVWDFGDGETSNSRTPTHIFARAGTYSVSLTVTDDRGLSSEASKSVLVRPPPAEVAIGQFSYDDRSCNDNVPIRFTVTNTGQVTAERVEVRVTGGYQDFNSGLGDIPAGSARSVSGNIQADDACGVTDSYSLILTATPANGPAEQTVATIAI